MASVSISANGAMTSPYLYSTATISEKSRSNTSVVLNVSIVTHLNSSISYVGTGYKFTGTVTAYGISKSFTLKSSSSSWEGDGNHTVTGTMTISVPATVTSISVGYKCAVSGLETGTKTGTSKSLSLSKVLASVTSVTAFSDTTNPKVTFSNPAGFKIRPYLNFYDKSGGTLLLTIRPDGMSSTGATLSSPYTWSLTTKQRNTIRDTLGTKTSCYCAIGIEAYSGSTYINYSSKGVTFTNVLKPPIFSDFSFLDVNEKTIGLTGDNSKVIKGYSTLQISISGEQIPIPQNDAKISHFQIEGKNYTYSDNFSCEINNWSKENISIYAVDSRGISTVLTKKCEMINYTPLGKGNISTKRNNNIEELTTLSYNGSFWNDNFGLIENKIKSSYKFKMSDANEYTEGTTTINPNISENTFSYENYILGDGTENGFLIENSYEIIVTVADELSEVNYNAILGSGIPAIAIYKNNVAIHGKYDEELGGTQVNGDLFLNKRKIIPNDMITIQKNEGDTNMLTTSQNYNIGLGTLRTKVGTKLSHATSASQLGNEPANVYCVKVGAGVSKIKACAQMQFTNNNTTSNMYFVMYVYRFRPGVNTGTGNLVTRAITPSIAPGLSVSACTIPTIVEVVEGDLIYLRAFKSLTNGVCAVNGESRTSLTVEVVE